MLVLVPPYKLSPVQLPLSPCVGGDNSVVKVIVKVIVCSDGYDTTRNNVGNSIEAARVSLRLSRGR